MTKTIGIAVLGCGYWGINYVRVLSEMPDVQVVVCDQRVDRLRDVVRRFPRAMVATNVDDALGHESVTAAIICTEANSHFKIARQCLLAGKHVLVEKPIATKVAEADALMALARSKQLILMVGHTFLYNPGVRKVKDYIRTREIGRVYYLYARRTNLGPIRHDVNALWDLAPHDISIFNYLMDSRPSWVSAVGARVLRNGREDVGFVSLGYPDRVVGHIHVSWADPHKVREVVVVGSDKRIVFNDLQATEQVRVFEKGVSPAEQEELIGEFPLVMRDGAIISPRVEPGEPLKIESQHFLDCITNNSQPLTRAEDGRDVVSVLEGIDLSIAQNGAPVEIAGGNADELYVLEDGQHQPNAAS
jgi:predicted dehydrogenase